MEYKHIRLLDVVSALDTCTNICIYEPSRTDENGLRWRMDEDLVWTSVKNNKYVPFDSSTYPRNLVPECYYDRKCHHIGLVDYPTSKRLFARDPNAVVCLGLFLEEKKEA